MRTPDRERWNARHQRSRPKPPGAFLVSLADRLPTTGRGIDVAGGLGRHAAWMAERGLQATLADVSDVALARAADNPQPFETLRIDLETERFPDGPWDLIVCYHYLRRPLFAVFAEALAPGGWLVVENATRSNLERNKHPSERFVLEDGELPGLVPTLEIVAYQEGWVDDRHMAKLAAVKPG